MHQSVYRLDAFRVIVAGCVPTHDDRAHHPQAKFEQCHHHQHGEQNLERAPRAVRYDPVIYLQNAHRQGQGQ